MPSNLGFGNASSSVREGPIARMSCLKQLVGSEKQYLRKLSILGSIASQENCGCGGRKGVAY
jgi:hypothetical protein